MCALCVLCVLTEHARAGGRHATITRASPAVTHAHGGGSHGPAGDVDGRELATVACSGSCGTRHHKSLCSVRIRTAPLSIPAAVSQTLIMNIEITVLSKTLVALVALVALVVVVLATLKFGAFAVLPSLIAAVAAVISAIAELVRCID